MEQAIVVDNLKKVFCTRERKPGIKAALQQLFWTQVCERIAIDELCFRIEKGERVAFVGPNGAGKSTTIKILSGILHPTSGYVSVCGFVPHCQRRRLAYMIGTVFGQRTQLWYHLPVTETFDLLARVYDQDLALYRKRRDMLIDLFQIGDYLRQPVRQLSLGQRMRCEIVASLLHMPKVLFLDEPTIGLDVTARTTIRNVLKEQSEQHGQTILLTSHDTGDMERLCDRVIVIHKGRIMLDQSIDELRRNYIRRKHVKLRMSEEKIALHLAGTRILKALPHQIEMEVELNVTPVDAVVQRVMGLTKLLDLTVADPPMEEIIRTIYTCADSDQELPKPKNSSNKMAGALS